ncbi:hypothetical protein D3C73_1043040 [compost metagenome]
MCGDDGFSVLVFLQHLVHPVDFVRIDIPAHVQDDEVLPVFCQQVIVAQVIIEGAAIVGFVLKTLGTEIFPVVIIKFKSGAHIMVSAQHAVPHPVVFKDFHCLVGNLPLVIHVPFINQVSCVDRIANIPVLRIVHNPLVLL